MRLPRTLNWIRATIVLLGIGALGLYNGGRQITTAGSALQRLVFFAMPHGRAARLAARDASLTPAIREGDIPPR